MSELKVWNSQILEEILWKWHDKSPIKCKTEVSPHRGGDYDLNTISISIENFDEDSLLLTPFVDPYSGCAPLENENVPIYALELMNAHADSRGGCQTDNVDLAMLHGFLKSMLIQAGFRIVSHHDEIF